MDPILPAISAVGTRTRARSLPARLGDMCPSRVGLEEHLESLPDSLHAPRWRAGGEARRGLCKWQNKVLFHDEQTRHATAARPSSPGPWPELASPSDLAGSAVSSAHRAGTRMIVWHSQGPCRSPLPRGGRGTLKKKKTVSQIVQWNCTDNQSTCG